MMPDEDRPAQGLRTLVVANRLPVRRARRGGREVWETSPGGLVSALMPILQRGAGEAGAASGETHTGGWIGWNGAADGPSDPFEHEGVLNIPVALTKDRIEGYYDGMSNSTLWPLYHDAVRQPLYRRKWWREYERVNRIFAEAAAAHAGYEAFVWVHDYHLHLVPGILRELRPDLRIGFFLHIPFPGRGLFAQLPWRSQIIRGTLGADVVGFQTIYGARNFVELARRYADARSVPGGVRLDDRTINVDAFPISIDSKEFDGLAHTPKIRARAEEIRERLGGRKILLGIDRMDYTKGIDVRLKAFGELLGSGAVSAEEVVLVQSAVPTRERVEDYNELRSQVEMLVGQLNGDFGSVGQVAVEYQRRNLPREELIAMYLAADVMVVTPMRDGMNLIAKEYVASRVDERGALILSEFAGASLELDKAIIVNPHDVDGLVEAMEHAIRMPEAEEARRMRSMRKVVFEHDVYDWADQFMRRLHHEQPVA